MEINKVLIIDDERMLSSTTKLLFQKQGIEAIVAVNGQQGIEMAGLDKPDMILLDIMMPGMNGWKVLHLLKENSDTRDIPVVIFTATDFVVSDLTLRQRGAVAVLRKPFHLKELLSVVEIVRQGGRNE